MCVYLCVCVWTWRLNPTELHRDEKHMQHIMVALHSLQHQWCLLFYHQSLGTSLCVFVPLPYGNRHVAFNNKAVLMTVMPFEIVALQILDFFHAKPNYHADKVVRMQQQGWYFTSCGVLILLMKSNNVLYYSSYLGWMLANISQI